LKVKLVVPHVTSMLCKVKVGLDTFFQIFPNHCWLSSYIIHLYATWVTEIFIKQTNNNLQLLHYNQTFSVKDDVFRQGQVMCHTSKSWKSNKIHVLCRDIYNSYMLGWWLDISNNDGVFIVCIPFPRRKLNSSLQQLYV